MSRNSVSRRDVLRTLAMGAVGGSVLQLIPLQAAEQVHHMVKQEKAHSSAGKYRPKFFSAHQYASLSALCDAIHHQQGEVGVRRILGVLSLAKKYGTAAVDEACAVALDMGVQEYRFVRRYLERCPQAPLSLQQVDPLIRELVQYRDFINYRTKEIEE